MSISGVYFNHGNIRKMVVVFGSLFSDMTIKRSDSGGNVLKTLEVPLAYARKEKYLAHLQQADKTKTALSMQLPRMSFEYTALNYDPTRRLTTTGKNYAVDAVNKELIKYGYNPTPYNFDFELNIMTKFASDTTQILEQILPFFGPSFTVSINENPDLQIVRDIPVTFTGMSQEDTYDGDFEERRAIVSTLTFEMKGYIWGQTTTAKVIKDATVGIGDINTNKILETYNVFVDPITAGIDDDFGFTETIKSSSSAFLIDEFGNFVTDEFDIQIIT